MVLASHCFSTARSSGVTLAAVSRSVAQCRTRAQFDLNPVHHLALHPSLRATPSSTTALPTLPLPQVHHQQLNRTKIAHVAKVPSIPPFHIDLLTGASSLRVEPQRRGQGSGPGQEAQVNR